MSKHRPRTLRRALFTRLGQWSVGTSPRGDSGLFLFFNHAVVGGADFVHLRVLQAVADARPTVFFTLPTEPQPLAPAFGEHARVEQVGRTFHGHNGRFFAVGQLAARVNQHPRPVLLGAHSRLYYEMLPLLRPEARCFDLLHALASLEHFSLPYVPRIEKRVFISATVRDEFAKLYDENGIDPGLKQRMTVIENCVEVPQHAPSKPDGPLRVLFVGRGSPEKRVQLVGRIAAACKSSGVSADFTLVGDCEPMVEPADRPACHFTGMLPNPQAVRPLYQAAHVLLLTSSREGFPLVIMEAMAHGAVPVCTSVGGIAAHVVDGRTGVLLPPQDDAAVIAAGVKAISALAADRTRLAALSTAAYAQARAHFGPRRFREAWRALLLGAQA